MLRLANRPWRQFLLGLFLAILGVRLFLVERYAASVPWVDEWEATGEEILMPWEKETLDLAMLIEAHNGDHRILATRLWEIFWYELNGTWDPKLVMLAKTILYAAAATLFIHLLTHALPRRRLVAAALLAVLFAFPFNFHNLMWAFQSQFDFFLLCSAFGWLALVKGRPVAALAIAGLSLFTLGGGAILAASYFPFCLWAWADGRWTRRRACLAAAGSMALAVVGVSLRADHASPLGTPPEQARAAITFLSWPHSGVMALVERLPETARLFPEKVRNFPSEDASWLMAVSRWLKDSPGAVTATNAAIALLLLAPTAAVLTLVMRRRIRGAGVWGVLGIAGFAFLMQVATGVARANEVGVPVRYLDVVALSLFSAIAAAFVLAAYQPRAKRLLAAWAVCVAPVCLIVMAGTLSTLQQKRPQRWLENVRAYFPTQDHAIFHRQIAEQGEFALPFLARDIEALMRMLDNPGYQEIVPRSVIAPNEPRGAAARAASAVGRLGWIIAAFGMATGLGAWWRTRRSGGHVPRESPLSANTPARVLCSRIH